jgi:hypothetical protein
LKRKDYLHEEARQKEMNEFTRSAGPSREDIANSVRNAIEELENMQRMRKERSDSAFIVRDMFGGVQSTEHINEREEIGLDVFEKLIPEIKAAALKFAQDNHNQELRKVAERLTPDEDAARTDLNDLLLLLEADDS